MYEFSPSSPIQNDGQISGENIMQIEDVEEVRIVVDGDDDDEDNEELDSDSEDIDIIELTQNVKFFIFVVDSLYLNDTNTSITKINVLLCVL